MIDEINDEVDDALEDYSETIIIRSLAGKELPSKNDGSNNSYSIRPITREEARQYPVIEYYDADIYIKEKEETERHVCCGPSSPIKMTIIPTGSLDSLF